MQTDLPAIQLLKDTPTSQIAQDLVSLTKDLGIYGDNLPQKLQSKLREKWLITEGDSLVAMRSKAEINLRDLLERVAPPNEETRENFYHVIEVMFCFYEGVDLPGKRYDARRKFVDSNTAPQGNLSIGETSIRYYINHACNRMAQIIEADGYQAVALASDDSRQVSAPSKATVNSQPSLPLPPYEAPNPTTNTLALKELPGTRPKWLKPTVGALVGVAVLVGGYIAEQQVSAANHTSTSSGGNTPAAVQTSSSDAASASQPKILTIDSTVYAETANKSIVFPRLLNLQPSDLAIVNAGQANWDNMIAWAHTRNGIVTYTAHINVVVSNPLQATTTITNIQVVNKQCQAPLSGSLLYSPSAGSGPALQMTFDLDATDSAPHLYQNYQDAGLYFSGPSAQYITVEPHGSQPLDLIATTLKSDCKFMFEISASSPSGTAKYLVSDQGKPFEATAIPMHTSGERDFTNYKEMYAGGTASPDEANTPPDTNFVQVNPKTFTG